MAKIDIPDAVFMIDSYYTLEGYHFSLHFEGRTIYSKTMDEHFYEARDEFCDIVANKLRKLLED